MRRLVCRLRGRHSWDPDPGDVVWLCATCGHMLDLSDFGLPPFGEEERLPPKHGGYRPKPGPRPPRTEHPAPPEGRGGGS